MKPSSILAAASALSATLGATGAAAVINIPATSRAGPPVADPLHRAACAHYYDLNTNADAMGNDNHTPAGLTFLTGYAMRPPMGGVLRDAARAVTEINFAHHRRTCYSPGEIAGGYVWPTDPGAARAGVITVRGYLNVRGPSGAPFTWTFALAANDATRVRIGGVQILEQYWFDEHRWKKFVHVTFNEPGVYALEIDNATNHVCEDDPIELYYAPRALAGLDGACGCGAGCAFDPLGCDQNTRTITARATSLRLVDSELLLARPDGAAPPAIDACSMVGQVVDPGSPSTFLGCLSDKDCTGDTPVCGAMNRCISGCGNGRLERNERCDDGNTAAGDGCDPACASEPGYACASPVNVLRGSSFDAGDADWRAPGLVTQLSPEASFTGQRDDNLVAEINGPIGGAPRGVSQTVALRAGRAYTLSLRYGHSDWAPDAMRIEVRASGTDLPPLSLGASGPFAFRSVQRRLTATANEGTITIRHDPSTLGSTPRFGLAVDDVELWTAGECAALDTDLDGVSDPIELAIGSNPRDRDTDGDGLLDPQELGAGPTFAPFDSDGDGVIDARDPDDDGDGVLTRDELGAGGASMPQNSDATVPMGSGASDTIPDYLDADDDGDSILTAVERMAEGVVEGDADMVPAYLDLDSDGDSVPDFVEAGPTPAMPANSDGMAGAGDRPDFLDTDSDNDCVPDSDPREASAARVDPAMPSASADGNCAGATCDRSTGLCISAPDAAIDANPSDAEAGDAETSDAHPSDAAPGDAAMDSGRTDASAVDVASSDARVLDVASSDARAWLLSGDGACACRAPAARGSRGTSATMALLAMSALAIARRVRRKR